MRKTLLVLVTPAALAAALGGGCGGGAATTPADGGWRADAADRGGPDARARDGAADLPEAGAPPAPTLTIRGGPPEALTAGGACDFALQAAGGQPPYRWAAAIVSPDAQGNGLQLDSETGRISGTPIFSGPMPLLVEVADSGGRRATAHYLLAIEGPGAGKAFSNAPLPAAQGAPYSFTFTTPWSPILGCAVGLYQVWGKLPPGLTLDPLGGQIGGAPSTAGRYAFGFYADPATVSCSQTLPTQTNVAAFAIDVAPAVPMPASARGASDWRIDGARPVLAPRPGGWDSDQLTAPAIVVAQGTYYLYYEGQGGPEQRRRIGLTTSSDGLAFERPIAAPVLGPGAPGAWDAAEVRLPSVHHDGAQFRMWYFGRANADDPGAIGLATSTDGLRWTRHPEPVFGATGGVGDGTAPGQVLARDGRFTLYYVDRHGGFGRATSADGITWTDEGPLAFDTTPSHVFTRPAVVADGSTLRMWYMRRGDAISNQALGSTSPFTIGGQRTQDWTANAIAAAASDDGGASWSLYAGNPVLVAGAAPWDGPGVAYPTVLLEAGRFRMWLAAGPVYDGSARGAILAASIP